MYTQLWNKYLPVLRILLKRSLNDEQTFSMNTSDFERSGAARKSGYKFTIIFSQGKVENFTGLSPLAKDLIDILLDDEVVKELLSQNDFVINMNSKFQLLIKRTPKAVMLS